jgi:hypothetical protein
MLIPSLSLFQFIIAIIFHAYPIYGCIMQLINRREPQQFQRRTFALATVAVMCLIGIAMGISAGKIIAATRESRNPAETGRVTFLQVSTEGIVLLSSLLFSTISILMCYFLNWSKEEQSVLCKSA